MLLSIKHADETLCGCTDYMKNVFATPWSLFIIKIVSNLPTVF